MHCRALRNLYECIKEFLRYVLSSNDQEGSKTHKRSGRLMCSFPSIGLRKINEKAFQSWTHLFFLFRFEPMRSHKWRRWEGWLMHLHPLKAFLAHLRQLETMRSAEWWCVNSCPNTSLLTARWDEDEDTENIFLHLNSCRFQQFHINCRVQQCHKNAKVTPNSECILK